VSIILTLIAPDPLTLKCITNFRNEADFQLKFYNLYGFNTNEYRILLISFIFINRQVFFRTYGQISFFDWSNQEPQKTSLVRVGSKINQVFLIGVKETRRFHILCAKCPVILGLL
jgi:hypothetical protein